MKIKSIGIFCLLVFGLFLSSCKVTKSGNSNKKITKIMTAHGFYSLEKSGSIHVILKEGKKEDQIKIKGPAQLVNNLQVISNGASLILTNKRKSLLPSNKAVEVYVVPSELAFLKVSGTGDFKCEEELAFPGLSIDKKGTGDLEMSFTEGNVSLEAEGSGDLLFRGKAANLGVRKKGAGTLTLAHFNASITHIDQQGSGNVSGEIQTEILELKTNGSGDFNLAGKANVFNSTQSGSGAIHAFDLTAQTGSIKNSGTGNAYLNITTSLLVQLLGSGNIIYRNKPTILNPKIEGTGKLMEENGQ